MKKLLIIMLLTSFMLSCDEKEENEEACYQCTLVMQTSGPGVNDVITSKIDQCGLTREEAEQVEKSGTNTTTSTTGGITVTVKNTTNCIKK